METKLTRSNPSPQVVEEMRKGIPETAKRIWDDLRTLADLLGPCTTKFYTQNSKEMENLADGADDIAGRLYKLAERIKEGK